MKTIINKEHKFRVEVTPNELLGVENPEPQNYFEKWLENNKVDNEGWNKKSEKAKKAYQKKYFETERIIYSIDENYHSSAHFHLKLNTDWTWNVIDLKTNIEYFHCYPVSMDEDLTEERNDNNIILQLPESVVDKNYYKGNNKK
jgi:hypothetical protein